MGTGFRLQGTFFCTLPTTPPLRIRSAPPLTQGRQGVVGACLLCTTLPERQGAVPPGVSAETPAIRSEADLFLFCFHFRQLLGCSPQNRFCGGLFAFDRLGRRKNRLPAALRRTRGAGSRFISFPLPFLPALRLPAPGRPPCPPASWAGNRGTRCRRGGRIWRCSFCSNPAGPACFPPRAARRA